MLKFFNVLLIGILFTSVHVVAQRWDIVDKNSIAAKGQKDITPNQAKYFKLEDEAMRQKLWAASHESTILSFNQTNTILTLPLADGSMDQFKVVEYDMMEQGLKDQYPHIRTYHGVSLSDPHRRLRADYTELGFRAMIVDHTGNTYIDHYQRGDKEHKVVYFKKDIENINAWACGVQSDDEEAREEESHDRFGDCIFRSYRLALATTAEYSNFHGATSAAQSGLVLTAVTTVMNRVNGVLEHDVTMRFLLVANTASVFYYTASSDPYSNTNGSAMLGQNQTTCDNVIGAANYDMGHVFSTGGGGVAYLGCICASNKAGGVTGQPNPIGDPFSIDYVAHEMGHQLGANHTQNNNCNRNSATAMEPGSASTIMGYAGICAPNVQSNSDAYYHAISIQEIKTEVQANTCHATISFTNAPPVVAALTNYSIPISTPFVLTASATDPENDPITYCWEQMNNQVATMPPVATSTTGPAFRSLNFTPLPSRYCPPLANVVAGTTNTWEVLPSVARTLNFRATARDYHTIAGCTDEKNMTVTTVAGIGPFVVTSQNTASTYQENTSIAVTWSIANTTSAPVSCANVNIYLSYDGGVTFPTLLIANTPNDGTENVTLPVGTTTTGRIMVKASNNIFYDVNNAHITITASQATFALNINPSSADICNNSVAFTNISASPLNGFNNQVTYTATNLPPGATVSFSPNPAGPNVTSVMTVSNLSSASGTFPITVTGTSGSIVKTTIFTLKLSAPLAQPTLSLPANGSTGVALLPTITWQSLAGAGLYRYEVSLNPSFSYLSNVDTTSLTFANLKNHLTGNTTYYWRVRGENNCNGNPWSNINSFNTKECFYYKPGDLPKPISAGSPSTIVSTMKVYDSGRLNTVSVYNVEGIHSNVSNLKFTVEPISAQLPVVIWQNPCSGTGNDDNFDINFSDGASSTYPCPPTNGQTYAPANSLATYVGVSAYGDWKMTVDDQVTGDGGSLNNWAIEACYLGNFCRRLVDHPYPTGIGSLYEAVQCAFSGDTITISSALANWTLDLGTNNIFLDKNLVIKANPIDNITVSSSSTSPTFVIAAGVNVSLIGFKIKGSLAPSEVVQNNGTLKLQDIVLDQNPTVTQLSLLKSNVGSSVTVLGNCRLE